MHRRNHVLEVRPVPKDTPLQSPPQDSRAPSLLVKAENLLRLFRVLRQDPAARAPRLRSLLVDWLLALDGCDELHVEQRAFVHRLMSLRRGADEPEGLGTMVASLFDLGALMRSLAAAHGARAEVARVISFRLLDEAPPPGDGW